MPVYTFHNKETDEYYDKFMKISERETYLNDNPQVENIISAPAIVGDHVVKRMDGGMKEVFSRVAEAHPNSPLAVRVYDYRSAVKKKVESIGKKHGMVRKDGGQDVSKLTNTYKTT